MVLRGTGLPIHKVLPAVSINLSLSAQVNSVDIWVDDLELVSPSKHLYCRTRTAAIKDRIVE